MIKQDSTFAAEIFQRLYFPTLVSIEQGTKLLKLD